MHYCVLTDAVEQMETGSSNSLNFKHLLCKLFRILDSPLFYDIEQRYKFFFYKIGSLGGLVIF